MAISKLETLSASEKQRNSTPIEKRRSEGVRGRRKGDTSSGAPPPESFVGVHGSASAICGQACLAVLRYFRSRRRVLVRVPRCPGNAGLFPLYPGGRRDESHAQDSFKSTSHLLLQSGEESPWDRIWICREKHTPIEQV